MPFIKNRQGMMDDFFDLVFTSIALLFMFLFVSAILNTDVGTKKEITLDELRLFQNEGELLHLLQYPVFVDEKEIKMKDFILLAVNTNNNGLFEEKMREYFEKNNLEGSIAVYDSAIYAQIESPLFLFSNSFFGEGVKSKVEIPNDKDKKISSLTVVLLT